MAIKTYKPVTPSRRHMSVSGFEGVEKHVRPERSLTESLKKHAGRNAYGRITVRHHGGGNKQKYRVIDWKRAKEGTATVLRLEYDPNRSAFIALLQYEDGEKAYIIAPVITEQSMEDLDIKKYAFEVAKDANKIEIKKAIEEIFGVTVIKVTTTHMRGKKRQQGRYPAGMSASWKKAVVKLSADSKNIELFEGMA